MKKPTALSLSLAMATAISSAAAIGSEYRVTITNLTHGQSFTPMLVVSHKRNEHLMVPGEMASAQIEAVAEGGDTGPLQDQLDASSGVGDMVSTEGLLGPGESVSVSLDAMGGFRNLSIIGMMLPTNDGLVFLDGLRAPRGKNKPVSSYLYAWDAGTEENDESCMHIPGPLCGGEPFSAEGGEGFIHVHPGIQGIGDLPAGMYDWNNPVAKVTVERMR